MSAWNYLTQVRRAQLRARYALVAMGLVTGFALVGCGQALFDADAERTQYERYDRSRDAFEPQYVDDEFGRKQPNISGRLRPK